MVYNAIPNDDLVSCQCQHKNGTAGTNYPCSGMNTKEPTAEVPNQASQKIIVATPLPSPVAERNSFFSVDPFAMKYPQVPSLPPSPIALQPNIIKSVVALETSPSTSSNATFDTCPSNREGSVSYAAVAQDAPAVNTITTTPTPSPTNSSDALGKKSKLNKTASVASTHSACQKKKSAASTKKTSGNSVDLVKIRSGQDKRTTFMIRNIPNKYTQVIHFDVRCLTIQLKLIYQYSK